MDELHRQLLRGLSSNQSFNVQMSNLQAQTSIFIEAPRLKFQELSASYGKSLTEISELQELLLALIKSREGILQTIIRSHQATLTGLLSKHSFIIESETAVELKLQALDDMLGRLHTVQMPDFRGRLERFKSLNMQIESIKRDMEETLKY
jgi:hypothetical protein